MSKFESIKNIVGSVAMAGALSQTPTALAEPISDFNKRASSVVVNGNQNGVSVSKSVDNKTIGTSVEFINNSAVVGLEYKQVGNKIGTLVTLKAGSEVKSFLLTGVYNGHNFSAKSTVGIADINGFTQTFAGAEFSAKIKEGLKFSLYGNATTTRGRQTLSVTEISNQVAGGTNITRTEIFKEGYNTNSFGGEVEYTLNPTNKFKVSVGRTTVNGKDANDFVGSYSNLSNNNKLQTTFSGSYNEFKGMAQIDFSVKMKNGWSVSVKGGVEHRNHNHFIEGGRRNNGYTGVQFSYNGDKKSSYDDFTFSNPYYSTTHMAGAENTMRFENTRIGQNTTTTFIPKPAEVLNHAPELDHIPDLNALEGDFINLAITGKDRDNDLLFIEVFGLPEGLKFENGRIIGTVKKAGNYKITVVARDIKRGEDREEFEIIVREKVLTPINTNNPVKPTNNAPVLNQVPNYETVEGQAINIPLIATDKDNDALTFTAENLPVGLSIQNNVIVGSIARSGSYNIQVKVSDGKGGTDIKNVRINVARKVVTPVNNAPVLNEIPTLTKQEGEVFHLTLSGFDKDGDNLTYTAKNLPAGLSIIGNTVSGKIDKEGSYNIEFEVSDGKGGIAKRTAQIKIEKFVTEKTFTETRIIGFSSVTIQDPTLEEGQTKTTQGEQGELVVTYKAKFDKNGREIPGTRVKVSETITKQPVNEVTRIGTKEVFIERTFTETRTINFNTRTEQDPNLDEGTTQVDQGELGEETIIYEAKFDKNGNEVPGTRKEVSRTITKQPVDQVTRIGTKEVLTKEIVKEYRTEEKIDYYFIRSSDYDFDGKPCPYPRGIQKGVNGLIKITYETTYEVVKNKAGVIVSKTQVGEEKEVSRETIIERKDSITCHTI